MAFTTPQEGDEGFLKNSGLGSFLLGLTARLYTSPSTTPTLTNVLADFTAAASIPGVLGSTVYQSTTAVTGASGTGWLPGQAAFTFTQTAAVTQTIRGWYLTDNTKLYLAEIFTAAVTLQSSLDQVRITGHTFKLHGT